jgi:alpha-beta hydrolase superfamily lysophospholipase
VSIDIAAERWGWATIHKGSVPFRWQPPTVATRGTVVVLPGRGEHAGIYGRFGARIAADGYQVVSADGLGTDRSEVALVRAIAELAAPVVLVGSDTGGHLALHLATRLPVAGVVAAGSTDGSAVHVTEWADELDARTACPTHRALLGDDPNLVRGALRTTTPLRVSLDAVRVPVLVIHGEQDVVAGLSTAHALAGRLPRAELVIVRGGRHDVLNDLNHRSVAAEIVQFLERVRVAPDAAPILRRAGERG